MVRAIGTGAKLIQDKTFEVPIHIQKNGLQCAIADMTLNSGPHAMIFIHPFLRALWQKTCCFMQDGLIAYTANYLFHYCQKQGV